MTTRALHCNDILPCKCDRNNISKATHFNVFRVKDFTEVNADICLRLLFLRFCKFAKVMTLSHTNRDPLPVYGSPSCNSFISCLYMPKYNPVQTCHCRHWFRWKIWLRAGEGRLWFSIFSYHIGNQRLCHFRFDDSHLRFQLPVSSVTGEVNFIENFEEKKTGIVELWNFVYIMSTNRVKAPLPQQF